MSIDRLSTCLGDELRDDFLGRAFGEDQPRAKLFKISSKAGQTVMEPPATGPAHRPVTGSGIIEDIKRDNRVTISDGRIECRMVGKP